jgi:hypothetical protein
MVEAVRTSETSAHSNETAWRYIPEDSKLHTRRRENLKSHNTLEISSSYGGEYEDDSILGYYAVWSCRSWFCRRIEKCVLPVSFSSLTATNISYFLDTCR